MLGDLTRDQLTPQLRYRGVRSFLIGAHQPAVADDIGGEYGGKLPFDRLSRHPRALPADEHSIRFP